MTTQQRCGWTDKDFGDVFTFLSQMRDLLPVGTRVRITLPADRFGAGATGTITAHNTVTTFDGVGREPHFLCYVVTFDEPQRGKDDEFGHNYTPPGGFTSGPFEFEAVAAIDWNFPPKCKQ
jgi:hypothetical protein